MTNRTRAFFEALPWILLVTAMATILMEAFSYIVTLWGESQLEQLGVLPLGWHATHNQLLALVSIGLVLPWAAYLGYKFSRLAVSAEEERLDD